MSRLLSLTILLVSIAATSSENTAPNRIVPEAADLVTALPDESRLIATSTVTEDAMLISEESGSGEPTEEEIEDVKQAEADIMSDTNETAYEIYKEDEANNEQLNKTVTEDLEANGSGYAEEAEEDEEDEAAVAEEDIDENGSGAVTDKVDEIKSYVKSDYENDKSALEDELGELITVSTDTEDTVLMEVGSGESTEEEVESEAEVAEADIEENGSGAVIDKVDEIESDCEADSDCETESDECEGDECEEDLDNEAAVAEADIDENGSGAVTGKLDGAEGEEAETTSCTEDGCTSTKVSTDTEDAILLEEGSGTHVESNTTDTEDTMLMEAGSGEPTEEEVENEAEVADEDIEENGSGAVTDKADEVESDCEADSECEKEKEAAEEDVEEAEADVEESGSGYVIGEADEAESDCEADSECEKEKEAAEEDVEENGSGYAAEADIDAYVE